MPVILGVSCKLTLLPSCVTVVNVWQDHVYYTFNHVFIRQICKYDEEQISSFEGAICTWPRYKRKSGRKVLLFIYILCLYRGRGAGFVPGWAFLASLLVMKHVYSIAVRISWLIPITESMAFTPPSIYKNNSTVQ
jgi:hypothetical protein